MGDVEETSETQGTVDADMVDDGEVEEVVAEQQPEKVDISSEKPVDQMDTT
jgi:hypothetical protein